MSGSRIGVFNMTLPAEGPISVPFNVDMGATLSYKIDLTQYINDKTVSFISGAYIDNAGNAQDLTLICEGTKQRIIFPASKQGWIPLMLSNPPIIDISQAALGATVGFIFVNFPLFPYII